VSRWRPVTWWSQCRAAGHMVEPVPGVDESVRELGGQGAIIVPRLLLCPKMPTAGGTISCTWPAKATAKSAANRRSLQVH